MFLAQEQGVTERGFFSQGSNLAGKNECVSQNTFVYGALA